MSTLWSSMTELEKMVLEYPEGVNGVAWDYGQLSWNPNVTWKFIQNTPHYPWKYKKVAHNPNVPWETIISNEKIWVKLFGSFHTFGLSPNEKIWTQQDGQRSWTQQTKADRGSVTQNGQVVNHWLNKPVQQRWIDLSEIVPFDVVLENLHLPWVWDAFSRNPSVNDKVVLANMKLPWDWTYMSRCLSSKFFEMYPNDPNGHPWNYDLMACNKNLTIKFIEQNQGWGDYHLAGNPVITNNLSGNPALTFDYVVKYPFRNWNWSELSKNPCITWEIYKSYPLLPWSWTDIQRNPNVTLDIIKNNPDFCWTKRDLSYNPNITLEFMKSCPDYKCNCDHQYECEYECKHECNCDCELKDIGQVCNCNDWNFSKLSSNWFSWTRKQHEYNVLTQLVVSCKIMANLPPYLLMEILEDEANFTYYELYNMINRN